MLITIVITVVVVVVVNCGGGGLVVVAITFHDDGPPRVLGQEGPLDILRKGLFGAGTMQSSNPLAAAAPRCVYCHHDGYVAAAAPLNDFLAVLCSCRGGLDGKMVSQMHLSEA